MNRSVLKALKAKALKRLRKMKDEDIDLSDIPEADESWFKRAKLRSPSSATTKKQTGLSSEEWDQYWKDADKALKG